MRPPSKRSCRARPILTSKELAGKVDGSLSNAKKLANDLGLALGIIILFAALLIAALLTLSNVAKRVREIGTLRAMGWSRGRAVRQILAEMLGIGILGAVIGVAFGLAVCGLVDALGPTLTYSVSGATVGASSASSLLHSRDPARRGGKEDKAAHVDLGPDGDRRRGACNTRRTGGRTGGCLAGSPAVAHDGLA